MNTLPRPPIRPMFDRLLVLPDPPITQVGSITLSAGAQTERATGRVVAVGEGRLISNLQSIDGPRCHVEPLRVQVGDHIFFNLYSGITIQDTPDPVQAVNPETNEPIPGVFTPQKPVDFKLIQEDDVLAILEDRPAALTQEDLRTNLELHLTAEGHSSEPAVRTGGGSDQTLDPAPHTREPGAER